MISQISLAQENPFAFELNGESVGVGESWPSITVVDENSIKMLWTSERPYDSLKVEVILGLGGLEMISSSKTTLPKNENILKDFKLQQWIKEARSNERYEKFKSSDDKRIIVRVHKIFAEEAPVFGSGHIFVVKIDNEFP